MRVPRSLRFLGRNAPLLLCVALVVALTSSSQEEPGSAALQTANREAGALQPAAPILLGRGNAADTNPVPADPVFGDEDGGAVNPDAVGDTDEAMAEDEVDDAHMRDGLPLTASHPLVAPVIAIQERFTGDLMKHPLVVGTATGMNERGEIAVLVLAKAPITDLPSSLGGVPVVIHVTGELFASKGKPPGKGKDAPKVDPTARFERPVPIGVSTGHPAITAGTIGCRVTKDGEVYALSNNHVYADENHGVVNTDHVIQPGTFDGGLNTGVDDIGTLSDFEELDFSGASNTIDAAIALCGTDTLGKATPSDGYGMPMSVTVAAAINQRVCKYGRTTGQTKGRIFGINATANIGYDSGVALFVGQILIGGGSFSAGGDSGSLIVVQKGKDARKPVALLFAGSSSITVANPIDAVLVRFGVTIDGE